MVESPQMNSWLLPQKMISYPSVSLGCDYATSFYSGVKGYNSLTGYTASIAEKAAGGLLYVGQPVLNRVEPGLRYADKYAAETILPGIENKAPIIQEEPAKIYEVTREATVERINNSYVGQAVNMALQPVLSVAERLSPASGAEGSENDSQNTPDTQTEAQETEQTLRETLYRTYILAGELSKLAYGVTYVNISNLRKKSAESIDSLRETLVLLQYLKSLESSIGALSVKQFLDDILQDVDSSSDLESKDDTSRKSLIVVRNLTRKAKLGYGALATYAKPYLNEAMMAQLKHGEKLLDGIERSFDEAKSLKDLSETWMTNTKDALDYVTKSLKELSFEKLPFMSRGSDDQSSADNSSRHSSDSSYEPSNELDEGTDKKNTCSDKNTMTQTTNQKPQTTSNDDESDAQSDEDVESSDDEQN